MEFLLANPLLLAFFVLIPLMFVLSSRGRKKMMEQQEAHQRSIDESLHPGVWVKTTAGFYGRYVDSEGDVVILDTPEGHETYWARASVLTVGESPFGEELEESESLTSDESTDSVSEPDTDDTTQN